MSGASSWAQSITTQSALNPILWPFGLIMSAMVLTAPWVPELALMLFYFGAIVCVFVVAAYLYLLIADPDRLQSERHQLDVKKLDLVLDEKHESTLVIDMKPSSNTHLSRTGGGDA